MRELPSRADSEFPQVRAHFAGVRSWRLVCWLAESPQVTLGFLHLMQDSAVKGG
jgi:hypothetical protein